jgi:hypothetical protein
MLKQAIRIFKPNLEKKIRLTKVSPLVALSYFLPIRGVELVGDLSYLNYSVFLIFLFAFLYL